MAIIQIEDINTDLDAPCTCGRSSTGKCNNSHLLTQDQFDRGLKMVISPEDLEQIKIEKAHLAEARNANTSN